MHDCGRMLHPGMVDGQITGGFAHALGAALYEEYAYGDDGSFLSGTFADYLVPTTTEVPDAADPAFRDALAVHAARRQGRRRGQLHEHAGLHRQCGRGCARRRGNRPAADAGEARGASYTAPRASTGDRRAAQRPQSPRRPHAVRQRARPTLAARRKRSGPMLLDPDAGGDHPRLRTACRNCPTPHFRADVTLGVGPVKGRYKADVTLSDLDPPQAVTLTGSVDGCARQRAAARAALRLRPTDDGGTALILRLRRRDRRQGGARSADACSTARRASSSASSSTRWPARSAARRAKAVALGSACAVREARDEARRLRLHPRRDACAKRMRRWPSDGADARIIAGGQIPVADAVDAAGAAETRDRHHAASGARRHHRGEPATAFASARRAPGGIAGMA